MVVNAKKNSANATKTGPKPPKGAHYVEPQLVAEVEFSDWTPEQQVRGYLDHLITKEQAFLADYEAADKILVVNHTRRFDPAMRALRGCTSSVTSTAVPPVERFELSRSLTGWPRAGTESNVIPCCWTTRAAASSSRMRVSVLAAMPGLRGWLGWAVQAISLAGMLCGARKVGRSRRGTQPP